jgi:hypothetical protein
VLSFGVFDTTNVCERINGIVNCMIFGLLVFNLRKYLTVRWFLNFCV